MTLPPQPDDGFYREILRGIGAPVTDNTMALIYAWRQTEGGKAAYNPFNTTHKMPGSTLYGTNRAGVQNYLTPRDGVVATVKTMTNGKYDPVIQLLRANAPAKTVAEAIIRTPWGTKGLLLDVLAMYDRGKIVVAPITVPPGGLPAERAESALTNAPFSLLGPKGAKKGSTALRIVAYSLVASITLFIGVAALRYRKQRKKSQES